ncbi:endonuclease domain-containing protein [Microbacterium sp. bgisy203]|uniref:endonuclease domain-containing protein n=1 Tax=Microbacterium sp. bgisy203 TaxID=3413799 RepID=UPI003D7184C4
MDIAALVSSHGGIAHRQRVLDAGVHPLRLRAAIAGGVVQRVRRYWVATTSAPPALVAAADSTARLACVSAARHRGWWMPRDAPTDLHLHVHPRAQAPRTDHRRPPVVTHWTRPLVAVSRYDLVESIADTLQHVADCLPREQAVVLWESAVRIHGLRIDELSRVRWRSPAAREVCAVLSGQSGSGIETIFVVRMRPWGLPLRQQVRLAGHDVDALIGERLVVQLDGFAFHSSSADRTRDLAHDRALIALGYTVLRFSYTEVIYRWPEVERALARAIAQGAHLAR